MPWATIPSENLPYMALFGYDIVKDDGDYAWYNGPRGRARIQKDAPSFWFDDVVDAQQAGATAILVT